MSRPADLPTGVNVSGADVERLGLVIDACAKGVSLRRLPSAVLDALLPAENTHTKEAAAGTSAAD
ncbi:MAG TPA: hypothetical protein VFK14_00075 [Solirubrobacterales bacterium]|nr:hypothetical protein [Solirubrobacterales bacterium]